MALIEDELKIIKTTELLSNNKLALPDYQRPYRWSADSTNTLFHDTYNAYKKEIQEYRLGSIILHKHDEKYYIVDGQQRLTTLSILLYCLEEKDRALLKAEYGTLSESAIVTNFELLRKRVNELHDDTEKNDYREYLLNKCTLVQIVTNSEQDAFQFFDSQNSRGKELEPHDLLKSYHLREMNTEEEQKVKIINQWENMNQNDLRDLFKNYLYPLTQWYRGKEGIGYSSSKIKAFKGINSRAVFNYAVYHKSSNLFVEQFNANGSNELLPEHTLNQFQLTQPLIAGKRFFQYALHYEKMLDKIQQRIQHFHDKDAVPDQRSGDVYIKQLYKCTLLFFADRFGMESLTKAVVRQCYSWAYSLRLAMYAVYPQTINKYAKGGHKRANDGVDIFCKISEMTDPDELKLIVLKQPDNIDTSNKEKYNVIYKLLCEWNGWQ